MNRPRILSLFSGYGGLDLAVENLTGGDLVAYAELAEGPSQVMAAHWPGVPNLGDVAAVDWSEWTDRVDVISAGFPCQGISNAGNRKGLKDERSGLWRVVAEAVRVVRPGHVFLENVSALRSRGLDVVAEDLAAIGYDLWWTCVRASAVGAPHHRDRWFGVAVPHAESIGRASRRPEPEEQPGGVRRAAGARRELPPHADRPGLEVGGVEPSREEQPPSGGSGVDPADPDRIGRVGRGGDESEPQGWGEPTNGGHPPSEWWGDYLPAIRRWELITGRPAPAPTEIGPRGGRRLAAEFAEWMMGVPTGWVTDVLTTRKDALTCIGNGVVPQQAEAAFTYLLNQIERNET